MQYRKILKTGEEISVLGYGGMRFPTKMGKIDVPLAKKQILTAIDLGVNYIDTAWFYHYGESESFLGNHILNSGRKINIATKLPVPMVTKTSQMEEIFEKQRKKLNVEVIDFYLLHMLSGKFFDKMLNLSVIKFMDDLKSSGRIRYMGFSFHSDFDDFVRIIDSYDWDFCQVQFNILDVDFQAGIKGTEYAKSKGISVFIMEPLRGGSLVTKMPKKIEKLYATADIQRTPAQWAFRFIYNHDAVTMVLSGMNDETHILENIETAKQTLPNSMSQKELEIIKDVRKTFNELMTVHCTGCEYCLPCPVNINIPNTFTALNNKNMFNDRLSDIIHLKTVGISYKGDKPGYASNCINCGKCEKACPQNIEIRKKLKDVQKQIETPFAVSCTKIISKFIRK